MTCELIEPELGGRVEADRETCWNLISFNDTYISQAHGLSSNGEEGWSETPILDDPNDGHGTAVTELRIDANPDAVIFFLEGFDGVRRAAEHPMVTIQLVLDLLAQSASGIEDDTEYAVNEMGKLHTGACDNTGSTCVQDATGGPPWSIGIAGFQEDGDRGKVMHCSGTAPDIVADWTQNYLITIQLTDTTTLQEPVLQLQELRSAFLVIQELENNMRTGSGGRNGSLIYSENASLPTTTSEEVWKKHHTSQMLQSMTRGK